MVIKVDDEEFYGMEDSLNYNIGSLNSYAFDPSMGKNRMIKIQNNKTINTRNNILIDDSNVLQAENNNRNDNLNNEIEIRNPSRGKYYDEAYNSKRNSLPFLRKKVNLNVWGILKDAVTKDLSKFCVPGKS